MLTSFLTAAAIAAIAVQGIAAIDSDWAAPANTLLLIILAAVSLAHKRSSSRERKNIAEDVADVKVKMQEEVLTELHEIKNGRDPAARTRSTDSGV